MRRALFFFSICLTVMAEQGYVEFVPNGVQLKCPKFSKISWHGKSIPQKETKQEIIIKDAEGLLYCSDGGSKVYYFYVPNTVCKNCFKLDGTWVSIIIVGDLLMTAGVMLISYICGQRKRRAPAVAPAQPGAQGPTSSSDGYEALNIQTRETAVYSVAGMHRTG